MKRRLTQLVLLTLLIVGFVTIANYYGKQEAQKVTLQASPSVSNTENQTTKVASKKKTQIALQVGHWKNSELPDELEKLRLYGGGATVGDTTEWETMLTVAKLAKADLEKKGYTVELIPATVPEKYESDIFITLHADGNEYEYVTGYKTAASVFDQDGRADRLASAIEKSYGQATGIQKDANNVTIDMYAYYAFNYVRYNHAVSPNTTAVMLEAGFLTNANDRKMLVNQPQKVASGLVNGIINFYNSEE